MYIFSPGRKHLQSFKKNVKKTVLVELTRYQWQILTDSWRDNQPSGWTGRTLHIPVPHAKAGVTKELKCMLIKECRLGTNTVQV